MEIYCNFQNCRIACNAIAQVAKLKGLTFAERPWNYHEPETTAWWLIPATEWPAYRHGKFFFDVSPTQNNAILCGVYIEKGLGNDPGIKSFYSSAKDKRLIMEPDWAWFRFLNNFDNATANPRRFHFFSKL